MYCYQQAASAALKPEHLWSFKFGKTRKSAASSDKTLKGSNYVLPPTLWLDCLCSVKLEPHMVLDGSRSRRKNFARLFGFSVRIFSLMVLSLEASDLRVFTVRFQT